MEFTEGLKFIVISVAAGVCTAVAITIATGYMTSQATAAARSELEQILILTAKQNAQATIPHTSIKPPIHSVPAYDNVTLI
uniref:Uncharacterized protein n=1 Tax=viral metagenome TaxID=1070528 RepID=A0A6M3IDT9_9ZZZZ